MRAGETVSDSLGIALALDCEPLSFRVVALPRIFPESGKYVFDPTIVFDIEVPARAHSNFLQNCRSPVADWDRFTIMDLRDIESSSQFGLETHHDDLVFYAIDAAYFGGLGGGVDYINQWKKPPSCVVRIVRDAAGTATSLVIDEVNWDGPSADLEAFMVNAPDPAAPWRATPGPSYR
jgi:hypothetical protein